MAMAAGNYINTPSQSVPIVLITPHTYAPYVLKHPMYLITPSTCAHHILIRPLYLSQFVLIHPHTYTRTHLYTHMLQHPRIYTADLDIYTIHTDTPLVLIHKHTYTHPLTNTTTYLYCRFGHIHHTY